VRPRTRGGRPRAIATACQDHRRRNAHRGWARSQRAFQSPKREAHPTCPTGASACPGHGYGVGAQKRTGDVAASPVDSDGSGGVESGRETARCRRQHESVQRPAARPRRVAAQGLSKEGDSYVKPRARAGAQRLCNASHSRRHRSRSRSMDSVTTRTVSGPSAHSRRSRLAVSCSSRSFSQSRLDSRWLIGLTPSTARSTGSVVF
jgi:hypothetical protein